jgi:hypothetical protein
MRFDAILVHVLLFIPIVESSWRRAASWIKALDTLFNSEVQVGHPPTQPIRYYSSHPLVAVGDGVWSHSPRRPGADGPSQRTKNSMSLKPRPQLKFGPKILGSTAISGCNPAPAPPLAWRSTCRSLGIEVLHMELMIFFEVPAAGVIRILDGQGHL